MAKKITNAKKNETKKVSDKKQKAVKKVEAVKVQDTVTEKEDIKVEVATMPEDDKELAMDIMKHVASEILSENGNDLKKIEETPQKEVVEKVKEKIEAIKNVNNEKVNTRINHIFGYLWNGQEMDW